MYILLKKTVLEEYYSREKIKQNACSVHV